MDPPYPSAIEIDLTWFTDAAERDKLHSSTPTRTFRAKIAPEENSRAEEELGKKIRYHSTFLS